MLGLLLVELVQFYRRRSQGKQGHSFCTTERLFQYKSNAPSRGVDGGGGGTQPTLLPSTKISVFRILNILNKNNVNITVLVNCQ